MNPGLLTNQEYDARLERRALNRLPRTTLFDWPEDAPKGLHWTLCSQCRVCFVGDRERVVCKRCTEQPAGVPQ